MRAHYLESAVTSSDREDMVEPSPDYSKTRTPDTQRLQPIIDNSIDQAKFKAELLTEERSKRLKDIENGAIEVSTETDQAKVLVDGIRWLEGRYPDSYQLQLSFASAMFHGKVSWVGKPIDIVVEGWLSKPVMTRTSKPAGRPTP